MPRSTKPTWEPANTPERQYVTIQVTRTHGTEVYFDNRPILARPFVWRHEDGDYLYCGPVAEGAD